MRDLGSTRAKAKACLLAPKKKLRRGPYAVLAACNSALGRVRQGPKAETAFYKRETAPRLPQCPLLEGAAPWGRLCSRAHDAGWGAHGAQRSPPTPASPRQPRPGQPRQRNRPTQTTPTTQPQHPDNPGPVCPRPRPRGGQPGTTLAGEFALRSEQARARRRRRRGASPGTVGLGDRTTTPASPRFI